MKSILREFTTDVKNKEYTRCPLGNIIGSDSCRNCRHFVEKVAYNEKSQNSYIHRGIVECTNTKIIPKK